jgi:hypothetical protein
MSYCKSLAIFACLGCLILLSGCGGKTKLPGLVPASGKLTLDGTPLANAVISFQPKGEGRSATATTNAAGEFQATTLNPNDGIFPGDYVITVSKSEIVGKTYSDAEIEDIIQKTGEGPRIETKQVVPDKYLSAETSGLSASIPSGGNNSISLELKK